MFRDDAKNKQRRARYRLKHPKKQVVDITPDVIIHAAHIVEDITPNIIIHTPATATTKEWYKDEVDGVWKTLE